MQLCIALELLAIHASLCSRNMIVYFILTLMYFAQLSGGVNLGPNTCQPMMVGGVEA